ncbi:receptor-like protein EIX2 [Neltuma alba]|uniref:receptor-like protein EIX2 n=1 Tax=Neltuma alba TaxID=207710 RepID=UPI0010A44132|nr:receptor-like protein EIX2 [Prosopis alba]
MASLASQISFLLLFLLFATTFNKSVGTSNRLMRCNENDQRLLLIFKQGVVDPRNQLSSWLMKKIAVCGREFTATTLLEEWLHHIAMLPSLSELHLRECRLRDFPSLDYINFTSLEVLDLSTNYNMMNSKLPDSFFNITNHIYHLALRDCNFHGQLPKALLNLRNLKHLDLGGNILKGSIQDWLGQYERLQYLDISDNLFYGVIPSSLGNISSLFNLDLSNNQFSGNLPETLGQLHNLNYLGIGGNSWVGVLSEKNFSNFSNLTSLDLSSTSFELDIDTKWVPPFQLERLRLRNTSIGPNVPAWLYTQRSLRHLDISRSGISTTDADIFWSFVVGIEGVDISNNLISDDISNVTLSANTSYFYASHNSLRGSLFSFLCQLESNGESKLLELNLQYNHLSGILPDCWANQKQLRYLSLGSNKLTGMLNWTYLDHLILEQNKFSGSLPNPVVQHLSVIMLRANQFMGNIPLQFCNISHLTILDLAENKLSGYIPYCLYNIMPPDSMVLWDNDEIIKIFTKGRELDYQLERVAYRTSSIIDLSANSLCGEIPKELFSNSQMQSLNLSRNHLTGKIPKEIGGLRLESLDLSYNKLFGEIPSTISNLSSLAWLNLSYNNFMGRIPMGTQIQSFDSWSFVGNPKLCGDPLPKKCNKKEGTHDSKLAKGDEDDGFLKSLYLGMGVGFAVGFSGVCGSLFLIRAWRHKFFRWFDHLNDQLYVAFTLWFKRFG